jgi:Carbamoyl-phosphate synthase L chain, ATP binding domain
MPIFWARGLIAAPFGRSYRIVDCALHASQTRQPDLEAGFMPKRTDIKSILIVGAGPIVIGQACEFDYSGTQACKALKAEGYRIILVNSNPATIMTDPELADATYIEPITPEIVAKIIEKERPDAILPTMGGQTALNTALALEKMGVLAKFNVEMIGAKADAIHKAEDRLLFRDAMTKIGLETPKSRMAHTRDEAAAALDVIGLPAIIRPSFTMGGTGGGIAYNRDEFFNIIEGGLDASPTSQVLIEESVLGWKEYEMEVVRDKADNCIIVCSIENIDPMGVHTGRPSTHPDRQRIPDHARRLIGSLARDRRRNRRLQRAVCGEPRGWTPGRDRDEPACFAVVSAGFQGDGLPHCQDRRQISGRLHPRRA